MGDAGVVCSGGEVVITAGGFAEEVFIFLMEGRQLIFAFIDGGGEVKAVIDEEEAFVEELASR